MLTYDELPKKMRRKLARRLYLEIERVMVVCDRAPTEGEIDEIIWSLSKWLGKRHVKMPEAEIRQYVAFRFANMVRRIQYMIATGQMQRKPAPELATYGKDQDENFYYIAGYTSGGAPYGVSWHEMIDFLEEDDQFLEDPDLPFEF